VISNKMTFGVADPGAKVVYDKRGEPTVPLYPLTFDGNVRMADLHQNFAMTLPSQLLAKWIGNDDIKQWLPAGLPITLVGTTKQVQPDPGNLGQRLIEGQLQFRAGQLLGGGNKDNAKDGGKTNSVEDIVGGLLGGNKKDDGKSGNADSNNDTKKKKKK